MNNLDKVTYNILYLMLLSPILSYISLGLLGMKSTTFYFIIFIIFYGIYFVLNYKRKIRFPAMLYFLLLYWIYMTVWGFFNGELEERGLSQILLRKEVSSIFFIILIINNTHFSNKFINNSVKIIKITVVLAAITSVIQVFNYSFFDSSSAWQFQLEGYGDNTIYTSRRLSIFGFLNLNEYGLSYVPLFAVLIGYLLFIQEKRYAIFLFLGSIPCLLSNTRYVILGFFIVAILVVIHNRNRINRLFKSVIVVLILVFAVIQILNIVGYNISDWINTRIFAEDSIEDTTRYKAILNFLYFFPKNPIFGVGEHLTREIQAVSNASGSSQIHIGYLAHLVSYGIVGSLFLFGFWIAVAKGFYKTAKNTNYWGSFIAFLTFLIAQATLVYYSIFFYGIIFAFVFDKYMKDRNMKGIYNKTGQRLTINNLF